MWFALHAINVTPTAPKFHFIRAFLPKKRDSTVLKYRSIGLGTRAFTAQLIETPKKIKIDDTP